MNNDFLPINEENTGTENNQLFMVPMVDNGIFGKLFAHALIISDDSAAGQANLHSRLSGDVILKCVKNA